MTDIELYKLYKLLRQLTQEQLTLVAGSSLMQSFENDLSAIEEFIGEMKSMLQAEKE